MASFTVGGILSILADLTFLAAAEYWRNTGWTARPATIMVAVGRTVEGIQALTHWPEAFGFAVLACGAVALARLCGQHRVFPASLGALAYVEALLLLGIAVTGLIPYDAGYNWLSLAAGAVVSRCCRYGSASASAGPRPRPRPDRPLRPRMHHDGHRFGVAPAADQDHHRRSVRRGVPNWSLCAAGTRNAYGSGRQPYSAIWRHAASDMMSRTVTGAGLLLARKYPPFGAA